ncbi:MAG: hypothetical protein J5747_03370 [Spirochaetaceae bacterium]|nr:hypothetical protein [Spirochaetaceae bacterium]MBO4704451.1 hypothetical protein [Spirochaetaceae bacterium]
MTGLKRLFLVVLCMGVCFSLFAQTVDEILGAEPDYQKMEVIEEQGKLYTLTIEYYPALDEARFIYRKNAHLFDQGEAMIVIRERAAKFVAERSYFSYSYSRKDVTKYDNDKDMVVYTSFITLKK